MTAYAWFVRGEKHAALCRQSAASVRNYDVSAQCLVITDEPAGAHWMEKFPCSIINIDPGARPMPMMLANIEAQIAALNFVNWGEPLWFMDSDTLLVGELPKYFDDICVTWRDHVGINDEGEKVAGVATRMPYNYGVMGFRPSPATLEALIYLRERVRGMAPQLRTWYGNQVALAELCGPPPASGVAVSLRRIPWAYVEQGRKLSITKLPGEIYNYTPARADEDYSSRVVLHFKGHSRELMAGYFARLLS